MKIAMIGTGYVGLVTGTCLAENGLDVTCVDIDQRKIDLLNNGGCPIYEPGLETMIKNNIEKNKLHFTTSIESIVNDVDAIFCAVGTPPDEDGSADLSYVLGVAKTVGKHLDKYIVFTTKSTVPVGTAQKVKAAIQKELDDRHVNVKFDVASNPEFLKEGSAVNDFMKPDRIVVGTESEQARQVMEKIYKPFVLNGHPIIFTDIASAEMIKYAANAMLATRISFMNDIANLCEIVGANVNMVRKGIGTDTRIGDKFLYAGIGYGGSCFPKDVKALIKTAEENHHSLNILKSVEEVNEKQKHVLYNKFKAYCKDNVAGKTIGMLGLAFKPNTDDMREAPALILIEDLINAGCNVKVYDPVAMDECKRRIQDCVEYCACIEDVYKDADALFVVTEWSEFRVIDFKQLHDLMKTPVIFDGRNIYDANEVLSYGIEYYPIGYNVN